MKKKLNSILSPEEKILYKKVLEDIANNEHFYTSSNAEEIISHLIDDCGFNKEEIYRLFKKISKFG
ncbi:hypothetical protein K8M07_03175 [Schnuerera sp. xch1]|uniref:hypothetical protein n=1 Tax=Schnuerera sp. xch1 TaxID=2874283 RepID=UPI001CBFC49D|nr:hypothetical protein [Schnuerera sp. xch1]MBZ2174243.1 hypothetical protein [Schnuerera sp. xch1]